VLFRLNDDILPSFSSPFLDTVMDLLSLLDLDNPDLNSPNSRSFDSTSSFYYSAVLPRSSIPSEGPAIRGD